jgi:hypothetical protein
MKRSTKVTLALMGAVGIGGVAYAMSPGCKQPPPDAAAADRACRSSSGSHTGWHFFSTSGGSATTTAPASAPSSATARGGFGAIGRAFASIGS